MQQQEAHLAIGISVGVYDLEQQIHSLLLRICRFGHGKDVLGAARVLLQILAIGLFCVRPGKDFLFRRLVEGGSVGRKR